MARAWIVGVVLVAACASARAGDLREEARLHYEVGRSAYEKGQWQDALGAFKKAYAIVPIPDLIYNIGHCQERLGQLADAAASYRLFLAARPDVLERAELEAHIRDLEKARAPSIENKLDAPGSRAVLLTAGTPQAQSLKPPLYRRWWFWTTIGTVVAVGVGVGLGVGLTQNAGPPALGFPGVTVR